MHLEQVGDRVVVVEVVFAAGDVVVVDPLDDRAVAEVLLDVEVLLPPLGGRVLVAVAADEGIDVGAVADLGRPWLLEDPLCPSIL